MLEALSPCVRLATESPGHAGDLAARFVGEAGPDSAQVHVLGGDGTLNEVVTGAFRAGLLESGYGGPCFAILPAGTTNVVSRDLGVPRDPIVAARALLDGHVRRVDLGLCRLEGQDVRPFLLAFGAGVDADAIRRVNPWLKRRLGKAAYTLAAILSTGPSWGLTVDLEGPEGAERGAAAASVIAANARLYGGSVRLAATSAHDDGLLELALLPSNRLLSLLRTGLVAQLAHAGRVPGVRVMSVTSMVVRSSRPAPVHLDAELVGTTPAEVWVRRRGIAFLVP